MKSIKFKLLFDGNENELETAILKLVQNETTVTFSINELTDVNNLREKMNRDEFEEMLNYFSFPGFSIYYLQQDCVFFIILYREHQLRHQLYERGIWHSNS